MTNTTTMAMLEMLKIEDGVDSVRINGFDIIWNPYMNDGEYEIMDANHIEYHPTKSALDVIDFVNTHSPMTIRQRIDEVKLQIKSMRYVDKLYDVMNEALHFTASEMANDPEIPYSQVDLIIALEEIMGVNSYNSEEELIDAMEFYNEYVEEEE